MSKDIRLYSLVLVIVLLLWVAPVRADYGEGSGCPVLAVPIDLQDDDVWHSGDESEGDWQDLRDLYPVSGTDAHITSYPDENDLFDCSLSAGAGTYYDGANHLWVLDDNLTCDFVGSGEEGDFRSGLAY